MLKETIVGMVQPLLGDAEQQAWNHVLQWLTRLRLLEGVPFSYIVPSNEMLPNESIRFFHVDRSSIGHVFAKATTIRPGSR